MCVVVPCAMVRRMAGCGGSSGKKCLPSGEISDVAAAVKVHVAVTVLAIIIAESVLCKVKLLLLVERISEESEGTMW